MTAQQLFRRAACLAALVLPAATGCVTVEGATAVVPAIDRKDAPRVLQDFTARSNQANHDLDVELNGQIETGVLGGIDKANLTAAHASKPDGNPGYKDLALSDAHFLIPELRGWPKWFVADVASNRGPKRWLMVFTHDTADEPWKASYLTVIDQKDQPEFAIGKDGYAEAVPAGATGLRVAPGKLSEAYTRYLRENGKGADKVFAAGPATTGQLTTRSKVKRTSRYVTQFADQPATEREYAPVALRTEDGGALVMFTAHHTWRLTTAQGVPLPNLSPFIKALLTGTPKRSVTTVRLAEHAAQVPAGGNGKVRILNRIEGVVGARGE